MKSQFSELSYAYSLTENLVQALGIPLLSAPAFPSTAAEGKKGAGYDLKLTYPGACLFLQFKLSHCMASKAAKEFSSGKFSQLVGGVKTPVYRMYLHPLNKSRQTSLMLKLEKRHDLVYYVAPLFHLPQDLNKYYFSRDVALQSRFIRPSTIKKMPDRLEHFVSFRDTGKPWRFSDNPMRLVGFDAQEHVVARIRRAVLKQTAPLKLVIANSLKAMIETVEEVGLRRQRARQVEVQLLAQSKQAEMSDVAKAEFVARTYFDAQLLTFTTEAAA